MIRVPGFKLQFRTGATSEKHAGLQLTKCGLRRPRQVDGETQYVAGKTEEVDGPAQAAKPGFRKGKASHKKAWWACVVQLVRIKLDSIVLMRHYVV